MTRMQGLSMAQPRTLLPDGVKQFLSDNLIRLGGALMLAAAGFVALALVSHSSADPSWNNIVNTPATNGAGFPAPILRISCGNGWAYSAL